jgi:hypothetical protein
MWKDKVLLWEETPHYWDKLGEVTTSPINDDDLYAKGILIWKKITLSEFIERVVSVFDSTEEYIEDKSILTGFVLAVSAVSLFPFQIKIIKDDDVANTFLSLIHREKAQHFILKKDFEESDFGNRKSLKLLIDNFIKNDILIETDDKYIINGKVLNGSHLLEDKE